MVMMGMVMMMMMMMMMVFKSIWFAQLDLNMLERFIRTWRSGTIYTSSAVASQYMDKLPG